MFCPRCQAEYRPEFTRCSDCDIELVYRISPDAIDSEKGENSGYVVVATVQGALEEGQICSFLEASGIPTEVRAGGFRKLNGINVNGSGMAEILAPQERAKEARDLLARADRGELRIDE